jgi:hypothetical protein
MRRVLGTMLVGATIFVVASCAGKKEGDDGDVSTEECVPYCERRQAGNCNELGNVDSCKLACGLLLTDGTPCGAASKVLLDCRLAQPDICRGCSAQTERANDACTM